MATYRIIFNRKKQLDQEGKALVQIEAYQSGKRRYFSTEVYLRPDQWDAKRQVVKHDALANKRIQAKRQELETFELTFPKLHGRPFTLEDFTLLTAEQTTPNEPQAPPSFSRYLREQLNLEKSSVELGTFRRRNLVLDRLEAYNDGEVLFERLTYAFVVGFDQYLRKLFPKGDNYVHQHHKVLKQFINRSVKSGYLPIHCNPYVEFKAKQKPVDKAILTEEEIRVLEEIDFPVHKKHLALYRDVFLFAYYTTLRISDITALRLSHITDTDKGPLLEKEQEKTERLLRLPLWLLHPDQSGKSKAVVILNRYRRQDDKPFFERSHFQLNKRLKEVLRIAKIKKPISFHSARHTGITHLVKRLPIPMVQKIAGHAKIQTTMVYLHLGNQDVERALENVKW